MKLLQAAALATIRFYQRRISPHKGFRCAYSVHTGRCGCSELGYRAIRRYGLTQGWQVLRSRMELCAEVHQRLSNAKLSPLRRPHVRERGDCDCGALPCDLDAPTFNRGLQLFSCCDVGHCDWGSRKEQRPKQRQKPIPPFSNRRLRLLNAERTRAL